MKTIVEPLPPPDPDPPRVRLVIELSRGELAAMIAALMGHNNGINMSLRATVTRELEKLK